MEFLNKIRPLRKVMNDDVRLQLVKTFILAIFDYMDILMITNSKKSLIDEASQYLNDIVKDSFNMNEMQIIMKTITLGIVFPL